VAEHALHELLSPHLASGQLDVILRHRLLSVDHEMDRVRTVTLCDLQANEPIVLHASYFLDATELGDLLPMAGAEHVTGAECQAETGELHAVTDGPDPLDQQAVTWCYALDYHPHEDYTIDRPRDYDFWRQFRPNFSNEPLLGWVFVDPGTLELRHRRLFEGPTEADVDDFWHYRRIFYAGHYPRGMYPSDITLVNWPQNDYFLGPLAGVSEEEAQRNLEGAGSSAFRCSTGCRPRRRGSTAGRATGACGCATTWSRPATAWPSRSTSGRAAASAPS
jgi:hypothetical protein